MATPNSHLKMMRDRRNYRNHWHTNLLSTCGADCQYCCIALCCAPCASYSLRKRALKNDMSKYVCCAGNDSCSGRCCESRCPELCLCMEVVCCLENSVANTHALLQDEFQIQTTKCDDCVICCLSCCQTLGCICSILAKICGNDCDDISNDSCVLCLVSRALYCTVCVCMQTQNKIEMDFHDGKLRRPLAAPPVQQMSRLDGQIPPSNGHP